MIPFLKQILKLSILPNITSYVFATRPSSKDEAKPMILQTLLTLRWYVEIYFDTSAESTGFAQFGGGIRVFYWIGVSFAYVNQSVVFLIY